MEKLWEIISTMAKNESMDQSGLALAKQSLCPDQYAVLEEHVLRGNNSGNGQWI